MTARRCDPYVYTAVLRRVGDSTLSAVEPWTHYAWSDAAFGAGNDFNRSYIGLPGGLNEADVFFRSDVLCNKQPTQFTARAFLQAQSWSQAGYVGNALAAGTVTVSAFTHDEDNKTQQQNGYFVRMSTTLETFGLNQQPSSFGSLSAYAYNQSTNPQAWGPLRFLRFDSPEQIAYEEQSIMYSALPLNSFFAGDMTAPSGSANGSWGTAPSYGYTYSIPLYKFEFGSIDNGSLSTVYTYYHRMHVDRTFAPRVDSFYLTLGVHSRTAYATVGMNPSAPFLCFPGIIFDSSLPEDVDNRKQIPGIGKSPARFRIATTSSGYTLNMPFATAPGSMSQASGVAPMHPVAAHEGRDVDDITSIVAMRTASKRSTQQQFADLFAFGRPLCQYAAAEGKYRSTWPTRQIATDVALFSGTEPHTQGTSSAIKLTLTGNAQAAAARLQNATSKPGVGIGSQSFILPEWIGQTKKESTDDALPFEVYVGPFGYLTPLTPETKCLTRSSVGISLGEFGNTTLSLSQRDHASLLTPGEWYGRVEPGTTINGPSIGDIPSKTYRVSIGMTSKYLWHPWELQYSSIYDPIDRQDISRANHGLPPGTESQWQQDTQAFYESETAKFAAATQVWRGVKNASEQVTLKSVDAIGTFTTYGRQYVADDQDWELASGTAPSIMGSVDHRLQFGRVLPEPVKGYFDKSTFADGTFRKIARPRLRLDLWANTETFRPAEIWKGSHRFTSEDKELDFKNSGGYGSSAGGIPGGSLGYFFNFGVAQFPLNIRMFILNCFFTVFAEKVADVSTRTHSRLPLFSNSVFIDMDEETGTFTPVGYLTDQLISQLSAEWE